MLNLFEELCIMRVAAVNYVARVLNIYTKGVLKSPMAVQIRFSALRLEKQVHYTFIFTLLCRLF